MRKILTLFLLLVSYFAIGQTYNSTVCCTVSNKSYGASQAVSTDGRSWFYDASNFVMRDYASTTEVNNYLNLPKYRSGHFPIFIHLGGSLTGGGVWIGGITQVWWYKDSTGNANLVRWYTDSTSGCSTCLQAANNLSDLANITTAKTNLSLQNVDNTSDATKNSATVVLTNKTISGVNNTLTNIGNGSLVNSSIGLTVTATPASNIVVITTPAALGSSLGLNIPDAGTGSRGALTAANWNYFAGKVDSIHISNDSAYWCNNSGCTFAGMVGGTGSGITQLTGDGTAGPGSGSQALTLATVNGNVFGSNTFLKFGVNGKGLTTSATAVVGSDITGALGFTPYNATNPSGYISNITGLISNGTNVTITGAGTSGSPYVISSSGGGSGITQLTGDVTAGPGSGSQVSTIANNAVTYAKIQAAAGQGLMGSTIPGNFGLITLGTNLSMSGSVLNATGGGSPGNAAANNSTKGIATFDSTQFSDNGAGTIFINTTPKGVIINENFSNLTSFQEIGSGGHFAVSSNTLNITGGTSFSLANYIKDTAYGASNIENIVMEGDITVGTISSTSFGVGFGFQSQQAVVPYSVTVGIGLNSGTGTGLITYYFNNSTSGSQSSPTAFTFSAGNVLHVVITYSKNTFYTTVINTSLTAQPIVNEFSWTIEPNTPVVLPWLMPNSFEYSIFALGGNHNVNNFKVTSNVKTRVKFLWCGDSIHKGYGNKNINDRTIDDIGNQINEGVAFNGSPAARIEDLRVKDILSYNSSNVILSIGTNNIGNSESATTVAGKMQLLVDSLVAAGYTLGTNLYVTTLPPRNSNNVTAVNDSLIIRFPSAIIDLYQTFKDPSTTGINAIYSNDGLHLNTIGNVMLSNIYLNFFRNKMTIKTTNPVQPRYARLASNNYLALGGNNQNPSGLLDVALEGFQSQARVSATPNSTVGLWLSSIADGHGLIGSGGHINASGNLVADATEWWGIGGATGEGSYYGNKSLTPGSTFSPTLAGGWTPLGLYAITLSTGATKSTGYKQLNSGGTLFANTLIDLANSTSVSGSGSIFFDGLMDAPGMAFAIANGSSRINRGGILMNTTSDAAGSENGILSFLTKPTSDTPFVRMKISDVGAIRFNNYGAGTFTGTATKNLAVDVSGNVIEVATGGGSGVTTIGSFSNTATTNALDISSVTLTAHAADGSNPGMLKGSGSQTIAPILTMAAPLFTSLTSAGANDSVLTVDPSTGQTHRRSGTFNLFFANGLQADAGHDSVYLRGNLNQNTTLGTSGFNFLITGLPNKTPISTDSMLIEDNTGQLLKSKIVVGVTTIGTFSGTSIVNGASISGSTLTLGVGDGSNPGMVSTTTQTMAGNKLLSGLTSMGGAASTSGEKVFISGTGTASSGTGERGAWLSINRGLTNTDPSGGSISQIATAWIGDNTFSAGSATTYTDGATLMINGPSVAGTNVTITNPYALAIESGNSLFNGNVSTNVGGIITSTHWLGNNQTSTAPSAAAGTGAGTGPTITRSGGDQDGSITVLTGTVPTGSGATIVTLTYGFSFPNNSYANLTPANAVTAALSGISMVFTSSSTGNFIISAGTTALTAATTYKWYYHVGGN